MVHDSDIIIFTSAIFCIKYTCDIFNYKRGPYANIVCIETLNIEIEPLCTNISSVMTQNTFPKPTCHLIEVDIFFKPTQTLHAKMSAAWKENKIFPLNDPFSI